MQLLQTEAIVSQYCTVLYCTVLYCTVLQGEIRRDDTCLDFTGSEVILYPCHGARGNQAGLLDFYSLGC